MGVYLFIIALADVTYRGAYIAYERAWRESSMCKLAGFLSTFSSELSVVTLTSITFDRFVAILFPLRKRHVTPRVAMYWQNLFFFENFKFFTHRNFLFISGVLY